MLFRERHNSYTVKLSVFYKCCTYYILSADYSELPYLRLIGDFRYISSAWSVLASIASPMMCANFSIFRAWNPECLRSLLGSLV